MSHPQAPDKPRIQNPYLVGTAPPAAPPAPAKEPEPTAPEPAAKPAKRGKK